MKNAKRLDYAGLAEVLGQRGVVDPQRLQIALQTSAQGPSPFPEVLVGDDLVGDWELSRVVCELYGLPFVPTDVHQPDEDVLEDLDRDFLRAHRLVPLGRYGDLLTVAMPGLVPADVLGSLAASTGLHVLPVVGSVESNNRWIDQHLSVDALPAPEVDGALPGQPENGWSEIFDEGDANVLMDIGGAESEDAFVGESEPEPADGALPPLPPPPAVD